MLNVTPTAHNQANPGDIADTVLMPGDPLRAKMIAERFLDQPVCYSSIRGMYGYTGFYKGKRISVQGHGMGMPSMGIYSYELYHYYDVNNIIRLGSAGSLSEHIRIRDIVIAMGACTDSNYAAHYGLPGVYAPVASYELLSKAVEAAGQIETTVKIGNILSTDVFYGENLDNLRKWTKMGILAIEMEAAALYMNAARAGKNALCLLTVSDCPLTGEATTAEERQDTFLKMIEIALEVGC